MEQAIDEVIRLLEQAKGEPDERVRTERLKKARATLSQLIPGRDFIRY